MAKNDVISDYNGYDYKKIFWEDADRDYEDQADRIAIRRLLPKKMDSFVDIGGGYGRLAKEYIGRAKRVVIFDYSRSELQDAKKTFGDKIETAQGDIYHLPFADNEFSGAMMVRVSHHLDDFERAMKEVYRILKPDGVAVVEVANKKTLPKMVRYVFGRSKVNPFDQKPANLTEISKNGFFNYHPKYVEKVFSEVGFEVQEVLSVSNFRSRGLKKFFGTKNLVKMERSAQKILAPVRFAPSIYYKLMKK